jgi:hypothetical protein
MSFVWTFGAGSHMCVQLQMLATSCGNVCPL